MDRVGDTDMTVARGLSEIVPKDFAAAVKDIKLAILQSWARQFFKERTAKKASRHD